MDGSKNKIDHEISKTLLQNERGRHENLPGSNGGGIRRTMLAEFASEIMSSNALCWVEISNGMKIFKFLLFIKKI